GVCWSDIGKNGRRKKGGQKNGGRKNGGQKNRISYFSVRHFSVRHFSVRSTYTEMTKNSQTNQASFWKSDAALIMLALTWGTSHVITKDILSESTRHSPAFYMRGRSGIAACCLGLLCANHLRRSSRKEIMKGAWLGLFSFAGIGFYTSGMVYTQASKAGFISGLFLVFTPLLGYLLFRSRPTRDHLTGLAIAVGGFALLSYPQTG